MHSVVEMPAAKPTAPEREESLLFEFEKTARATLQAEELPDNPPSEASPELPLNAERIAILTRILPNSDKAIIVVGESDQFQDGEVLTSPGASVETDKRNFSSVGFSGVIGKSGITNSYVNDYNNSIHPKECYRVGPFADEISASVLLDSLISMDVTSESSMDVEVSQKSPDYIVLTVNQSGDRSPRELEQHLRNSGIKDLYRFRQGENKGRISLGVYLNERRAQMHQDNLSSKGIDTEVVAINRELSTVWLNMTLNSAPKSQVELESTVTSLEPDAGVQRTECEQQHFAQSNKNNI
jgi:hypothetical protein